MFIKVYLMAFNKTTKLNQSSVINKVLVFSFARNFVLGNLMTPVTDPKHFATAGPRPPAGAGPSTTVPATSYNSPSPFHLETKWTLHSCFKPKVQNCVKEKRTLYTTLNI